VIDVQRRRFSARPSANALHVSFWKILTDALLRQVILLRQTLLVSEFVQAFR
jgi:hypothetical protein